MGNLHHAIKYLGKLGPAQSSAAAVASLYWLWKRSSASGSARTLPWERLTLTFRGQLWQSRDAPGDQTTPLNACTHLASRKKLCSAKDFQGQSSYAD